MEALLEFIGVLESSRVCLHILASVVLLRSGMITLFRHSGILIELFQWISFTSRPDIQATTSTPANLLRTQSVFHFQVAKCNCLVGATQVLAAHSCLLFAIAPLHDTTVSISPLILFHTAYSILGISSVLALYALWLSLLQDLKVLTEISTATKILLHFASISPLIKPLPLGSLAAKHFLMLDHTPPPVLNPTLFAALSLALDIGSRCQPIDYPFNREVAKAELSQLEVDIGAIEVALMDTCGCSTQTSKLQLLATEAHRIRAKAVLSALVWVLVACTAMAYSMSILQLNIGVGIDSSLLPFDAKLAPLLGDCCVCVVLLTVLVAFAVNKIRRQT